MCLWVCVCEGAEGGFSHSALGHGTKLSQNPEQSDLADGAAGFRGFEINRSGRGRKSPPSLVRHLLRGRGKEGGFSLETRERD